ncbi:MAG: D-TA family PLP-dependent enzyme [Planctomycetota bacterium]|nr:D-TA family PLP-dependent enzyme [Planctomycetota bacterium]
MPDRYAIEDTSAILSPGLVVFRDLVEANTRKMIEIAGSPARLRPHCKTHKMRQVAEMQVALGITKHKAATFAEAEMLASAGVRDIFLAYNMVGPNIRRATEFVKRYPDVALIVTADHVDPIRALGKAMSDAGVEIGVSLDVDSGQHRTGIPNGEQAVQVYAAIGEAPGLTVAGFHLYDGQNHQTDLDERRAAVRNVWNQAVDLKLRCERAGLDVPRIVCGGTGSFPLFAEIDDPVIELSPGTCAFYDTGYGRMFPDLDFTPAAVLLTRVISRPTSDRITLDLGYKAVASDPPAGKRVFFPALPDAQEVLQNEEHLVLQTPEANRYQPGDELIAIPTHICPTSAMHHHAWVVQHGKVCDEWAVIARDRKLNV